MNLQEIILFSFTCGNVWMSDALVEMGMMMMKMMKSGRENNRIYLHQHKRELQQIHFYSLRLRCAHAHARTHPQEENKKTSAREGSAVCGVTRARTRRPRAGYYAEVYFIRALKSE